MIENFRRKAREDYRDVKEIFDRHGLKFFAFYGTALGAVREGDFIDWDYDIDLASIEPFSSEKKEAVMFDLKFWNFKVILRNPEPDGNLWFERSIHGDIYWMKRAGDFYTYTLADGTIAIKIPEKYFRNFREWKLGDSRILVPDPAEPYLEATYDKDWRTPKKGQQGKFLFPEG